VNHLTAHVADLEIRRPQILEAIKNKTGIVGALILRLGSHAQAKALLAWRLDKDLPSFKQWIYVAASLHSIYMRGHNSRGSLSTPSSVLIWPLVSDSDPIIEWYADYEKGFHAPDTRNPNKPAYHDFLAILALKKDWSILYDRSDAALAKIMPKSSKYVPDFRFYRGLAEGNIPAMEAALAELTSPKIARRRNNAPDMGYTRFFIGTDAVVLAKIAWRSGYKVAVDTPFVPTEWLPIEPLSDYVEPYEFMKQYRLDLSEQDGIS
jgi:hypothetical protein